MLDFISVLSMCVGLVFFVLADNKVQPNFDSFGKQQLPDYLAGVGEAGANCRLE